jgi:hypothetical protein
MHLSVVAAIFCGLTTVQPVSGQPQGTDLQSPASVLELPSSPEFFRAVSKEAKPRWRQLYRATPKLPHRERGHSAFVLGVLLCEALIAAEARDAQYVRNSTQDIRDCLTLLGLAEALEQRLPAIHEFAERQNWSSLRFELEALEIDCQRLLAKQLDSALSPLIALGRHVRCLDVCAAIGLESGRPIGIADPDYYAALGQLLGALPASGDRPAFVEQLLELLEGLQQGWSEVVAEETRAEQLAVTAEAVGHFLDRIMEPAQ